MKRIKEYYIRILLWIIDHKSCVITWAGVAGINMIFMIIFAMQISESMPIRQKNIFLKTVKIEEARKAYQQYRTMDKRELQNVFFQIAGEWTYELGGSNQFKKGDCIGAVDSTLEYFGAMIPRETVQTRIARLERLRASGATFKCISQYGQTAPKTGDLIFIQTSYNSPSHEAIVYDCINGYVRYVEMGGITRAANLTTVRFGDASIYAIYSMTIETWLGE